eukprot:355122-Chlamydomonas_euryale.AAC.3
MSRSSSNHREKGKDADCRDPMPDLHTFSKLPCCNRDRWISRTCAKVQLSLGARALGRALGWALGRALGRALG